MEQMKQLLVCSKHPNIENAVKLLIDTHNTRENVRQFN